ncbi:MAG: hypothetical protein WCP96_11495 [Methylococcaceae bacterium]
MNSNAAIKPTEAVQPAWLYSTVKQFSERHPAFTVGSLRALIFNANSNGLNESGAIVRINRRVLINEPNFFIWVTSNKCGVQTK